MKQGEHEVLDNFTVLKNSQSSRWREPPQKRVKLPKKPREATGVFAFSDCGYATNKREERGFFDAFRS
jgi:hypothetical protein